MHFREIGLKIASGIISFGIPKNFIAGYIILIMKSNIPEYLNAPIATKSPIKVGNIFKTISKPSFAPFKKISNTFFFSIIPYTRIIRIVKGIAKFEIYSINFIITPSEFKIFSLIFLMLLLLQ